MQQTTITRRERKTLVQYYLKKLKHSCTQIT